MKVRKIHMLFFRLGAIAMSLVLSAAVLIPTSAYAQVGLDAVSQQMIDNGMFRPHANNCVGASEAFLPLGAGGTSGSTGLCVELAEKSPAAWEVARQACADLGKRLFEPSEYKIACNSAGALSLANMTDDDEWASNFTHTDLGYDAFASLYLQLNVPIAGSGSCLHFSVGNVSEINSSQSTFPFRCVR